MEEYRFECKACNFKCKKKGDYNRHIQTKKHIKITNDSNKYICELCNKVYLNRSGLWRHKKTCNPDKGDYKELYFKLLKEQNKLKTDIVKMYEELLKKQEQNEELMKTVMENMGTTTISQI